MKAGSLLDDNAVALRESRASPSSGEVCLEVCLRLAHLSAFICFLTQENSDQKSQISNLRSGISELRSEISNLRSEISNRFACVAEQQKHPPSKSGVTSDFVGASPTTCTRPLIQGCRLTGKPSVSKIEILGSNPSVPANRMRNGER